MINVGSCQYFNYTTYTPARCFSCENSVSILNLTTEYNQVVQKTSITVNRFNALTTANRALDYDWTNDIAEINASSVWLWGSYAGGGVGLVHIGGLVAFIVSNGYYTGVSNPQVGRYYVNYTQRADYSTNKMSSVMFAYFNYRQIYASIISPLPTDAYGQYIRIMVNYDSNDPTNPDAVLHKYAVPSTEYSRGYYYDPSEMPWTNAFASADLDNSVGILTSQTLTQKWIYPYRPMYLDNGSYWNNSTSGILDDELYGVSGLNHEYGHWYGEEPPEDDDDQGDDGDGDNIQVPPAVPTLDDLNGDATDTGFVRIYRPSSAELRGLANYMFSNITDADATQLKKLLSNPLDYIIGLNMCHFTPDVGTYEEDVKLGGLSIGEGLGMFPVSKQYVTMSGGSYTLVGQKGNYLDYSPFTKIQIYIPYTGMHDLPTDLVQNSTLSLTYIVDLLSGALVAHLAITKSPQFNGEADATDDALVFTYTGNCFTPIPIANADYRGAVNGMLGLCGGAISSAVSGNPMALFKAGTSAIMNAKPTIQSKASVANDFGFMSGQVAYLIISRPIESKPSSYYDWVGHTCNQIRRLSSFAGGVLTIKDDSLWTSFDNTNITDSEAQEIRDLFKVGVYV